MVRQMYEDWIAKSVMVMGTWAAGALKWFQARADQARNEHKQWLSVNPEQRAALEKQYMLGETIRVPDASDQLESLLGLELLEVIPEFMSQFAMRHAIFDSIGIISMVMRKLLQSHEFSRMGIEKGMLRTPGQQITTFGGAARWLEDFMNRLSVAVGVGSLMEPRELHAVMLEVLKPTTSTDLKFALMWEKVSMETAATKAVSGESAERYGTGQQ
eukprot:1301835-Amphidinium_carterae.2